jgi:phosphoenolpyruvate phosphomutase
VDVEFIENKDFESTGELLSLHKALDRIDGDMIISFGDILFRQHILNNLLAEEHDIVIAVDAMWQRRRKREGDGYIDYITATRPYSLSYDEEDAFLTEIGPDLSADKIHGEWIGLIKTTARGSAAICDALVSYPGVPIFADCASTIFSITSSGWDNACRPFTSPDNGWTWTI